MPTSRRRATSGDRWTCNRWRTPLSPDLGTTQRDIFDETRGDHLKDWYALKDPAGVLLRRVDLARGKMQEIAEGDFDLVDDLGLAALAVCRQGSGAQGFPAAAPCCLGLNLNKAYVSSYGYGIAISQAACYASMDQLGVAQYVTRLGMAFDDLEAVATADGLAGRG